jgi:hypothetical protein
MLQFSLFRLYCIVWLYCTTYSALVVEPTSKLNIFCVNERPTLCICIFKKGGQIANPYLNHLLEE